MASQSGSSLSGSLSTLAADIAAGKVSPSSVYLPNLNLLKSGPQAPGQTVGVGYTSNPAPMGIGDFGLGTSPYAYNTSHFAGSLTLSAANGTFPGAYYFITPPRATGGSYNSPYYFGIQLNTVTSNISVPGNDHTSFWTQNVITLNGNWITFEDNVWNFSNGALNPGSILSGNGTGIYPVFYYDYGPSVALRFPVTINLYNNVSVVNHDDQVTFGYRVVDSAGTFHGVYDTVVFNNPNAPANPPFTPAFQVSGKYTTPLGLDYDSELVFGGPGGGSNAVLNNITGTETLQYSNLTSGGWKSVPSAYDFGADTGETAIGVAETWSPGGIVGLSAGPSLLYGLWGARTSTAAASGAIEFQGSVSPGYGFVFIGDGGHYWNYSYVPTNAAGSFLTYLPPVNGVFPLSGSYYVFGIADAYARTYLTETTTALGISLALASSPGQATEPIYLNGNAQAAAAATAIMGWVSGPYLFSTTVLNGLAAGLFPDAMFFDHLNDWGFVTFNAFQATGMTHPINDSGVDQGYSDYGGSGTNYYFMDGPAIGSPPTLLGLPPAQTHSLPHYGGLVAFYSDAIVQVYSQVVYGYFGGSILDASGYFALNPAGGAVVIWSSPSPVVRSTAAFDGSYGVYIAGSTHASVTNVDGSYGANGVTLAGSNSANVNTALGAFSVKWTNDEGTVNQLALGVYDIGGQGGTFTNIYALYGGFGYYGAGSSASTINDVVIEYQSTNITTAPLPTLNTNGFAVGVYLAGTSHITVNNTTVVDGDAIGVEGFGAFGTTITNTTTYGYGSYEAAAVYLYLTDYTNVTNTYTDGTYLGGIEVGAGNTTFSMTTFFYNYLAFYGNDNNYTTFSSLTEDYTFAIGVEWFYSDNSVFATVTSYDGAWAAVFEYDRSTTLTNLNATLYEGVLFSGGFPATVTKVTAWDYATGIYLDRASGVSISTVTSRFHSTGVQIYQSNGDTVTGVLAFAYSYGVYVDPSMQLTFTNLAASGNSIAIHIEHSTQVSVTGVTATGLSIGVELYDSNTVQLTTVAATDSSIGVSLYGDTLVGVSGVTATNTKLQSPWSKSGYWNLPIAAVVTEYSSAVTITNVNATTYPALLYDLGSNLVTVTSVNATGGWYGIILNGTSSSYFTGVGLFHDFLGVVLNEDSQYNTFTASSFVDDTSYGVAVMYGYYNTFYNNRFIGDNGATGTYNPAHIQAYAAEYNYFYIYTNPQYTTGEGNYWADWHTYGANGYLAPYPISGRSSDLFPIGPQETFTVSFTETGLTARTSWSATLNGVTVSGTTATLNVTLPMGTYSFQVGEVAGYTVSPSSGSVTLSAATYTVSVTFTAIPPTMYAVTLSAGGLSPDTTWSATVNGVTQSTSGTTLVWYLVNGAYAYSFNAVSGYNLGTAASGNLTVAGAPLSISTSYSPKTTPSLVSTDTFNMWLAVAIAIGVIALVLGLLAVFLRRRSPPANQGAQAWTPPAAESGGSSGTWSEGPPAGGAPPS